MASKTRRKLTPPPICATEQFKQLPPPFGYYWISDRGRVWASVRAHFLKPRLGQNGHHRFPLNLGKDRAKVFFAHRLVLESFVGPCPPGHEGCHNNSLPFDNRVENLRWGTPASNGTDRVGNGKMPKGEKVSTAKLTASEVKEIRRRYALIPRVSGFYRAIRNDFGISDGAIHKIVSNKSWRHLL